MIEPKYSIYNIVSVVMEKSKVLQHICQKYYYYYEASFLCRIDYKKLAEYCSSVSYMFKIQY